METLTSEKRAAVEKALRDDPGGVLEYLAREHGVTPAEIVSCLPEDQATTVPGSRFEEVMAEMTSWGEVTFLVHTDDVILECKAAIPPGSSARGFFNLHGAPLGGHLKADNCASISFVSRPLFTSDTRSVQFHNRDGGCMFKVYLGRDENRALIPAQVAAFERLRDRLATARGAASGT